MGKTKRIIALVALASGIGFSSMAAFAQEGILYRARLGNTNSFHLRFPAIEEYSLDWDEPVLKPKNFGDIIDFYGPCDYARPERLRLNSRKEIGHEALITNMQSKPSRR